MSGHHFKVVTIQSAILFLNRLELHVFQGYLLRSTLSNGTLDVFSSFLRSDIELNVKSVLFGSLVFMRLVLLEWQLDGLEVLGKVGAFDLNSIVGVVFFLQFFEEGFLVVSHCGHDIEEHFFGV